MMEKNIAKAMALIQELRLLQDEIYEAIMAEVDTVETLPGITRISNSPKIITVPFSTVMAHSLNLSPEYYIPEAQADAIRHCLSKKGKDINYITESIGEMIQTKKVKGNDKNKTVYLNPATIDTLKKVYEHIS